MDIRWSLHDIGIWIADDLAKTSSSVSNEVVEQVVEKNTISVGEGDASAEPSITKALPRNVLSMTALELVKLSSLLL